MSDQQAPRRWKTDDELDPDEHRQRLSADRRHQDPPRFETDAYKAHRREALAAAGIDEGDGPGEGKPLEEMTPDQHLADLRGRRP